VGLVTAPPWLRRAFWSVYGRYAWDKQGGGASPLLVQRVVDCLTSSRQRPGESVLDAGCGTGNYSMALARAGFRVTGIDSADGMLARARSKVAADADLDVALRHASLDTTLPYGAAQFDHAVLVSVLQAVTDPMYTLRELRRVLKPGGTLLLVHHPRPDLHALPLREEVRVRLGPRGAISAGRVFLITAKAWAERNGGSRYWSPDELRGMLRSSGYQELSVEPGRPIVIHARRADGNGIDRDYRDPER
jgi:SAM-dependent methyltransferase